VTDTTSGGFSAGNEPVSRRLPLRSSTSTRTAERSAISDPWSADTNKADADNPFSGTALGQLPEKDSTVNPFDTPAAGSPSAIGDDSRPSRRARTSFPVLLGLICTVVAACAGLTAVLAPAAIAAGGLGIVFSVLGLFTARRSHVSGRLVAVLSILIGLAAIGLGVTEHLGTFSWLNADLPQHARNWLNHELPFLG
jgi:hypothetical protein